MWYRTKVDSVEKVMTRVSAFLALAFLLVGCGKAKCENGNCDCRVGASCEFYCEAPPCHVDCQGNNDECIGECANGDCSCGPGSECEFSCHSEPCHVTCEDSSCTGECGNGECVCEKGSTCDFECKSGPCHVDCEGDNERCDGQCANGSCTCGPDSTCVFECTDANCSFNCEEDSACLATCPGGTVGNQGCRFEECAAGEVVICADGVTIACGADCPAP